MMLRLSTLFSLTLLAGTIAFGQTTVVGGGVTLPANASGCLANNGSGTLSWGVCGGSQAWPAGAGIAVYAGSNAWGTSLTAPAGALVGTTATQTLTNKTVDGVAPATFAFIDPTSSIQTQLDSKQATLSLATTGSGAATLVGSTLTIPATGVIATTSTTGTVKPDNTSITVDGSGVITASANTSTDNNWAGVQYSTPQAISVTTNASATVTLAFAGHSNNATITLDHSLCPCTLANPTGLHAGQSGMLAIVQSATGSDLISTYGGNWKFSLGAHPTLSTGVSALDVLPYYAVDTTHIVIGAGVANAQ